MSATRQCYCAWPMPDGREARTSNQTIGAFFRNETYNTFVVSIRKGAAVTAVRPFCLPGEPLGLPRSQLIMPMLSTLVRVIVIQGEERCQLFVELRTGAAEAREGCTQKQHAN